MDAGCIDAEDVAALLDEREAAAPDEPLSLATIARRNLPDDFLELAEPEAIARAVAKLDQVRLDRCRLASFVGGMSVEVRRASFANVTALYLQRNRHRPGPEAMNKVGGAVDGINDPAGGLGGGFPLFAVNRNVRGVS